MNPITREEQYLQGAVNAANGQATGDLPEPITREEKYLKGLVDAIENGGGSSLPEVTSADNGKVLKVEDGEWGKGDVATTFNVDDYDDGDYHIANASLSDIFNAFNNGILHILDSRDPESASEVFDSKFQTNPITILSLNTMGLCSFSTSASFNKVGQGTIRNGIFQEDEDGVWLSVPTTEGILPSVSSSDNGKVLKVEDGEWGVGDALPETTSEDNGKVSKVVNGAWSASEGDTIEYTPSASELLTIMGVFQSVIAAAVQSPGTLIAQKASGNFSGWLAAAQQAYSEKKSFVVAIPFGDYAYRVNASAVGNNGTSSVTIPYRDSVGGGDFNATFSVTVYLNVIMIMGQGLFVS